MAQPVSESLGSDFLRQRFTSLAREFYNPVYRFIARQVRNPEDAADITQQVFMRGFQSFQRFQQDREFAPWIFTIARRCMADYFRSNRLSTEPVADTVRDPSLSPVEETTRRDGADHIWKLASGLKPNWHQILLLHYKEHFSINDTAGIMGITTTHAKVMLFRARNALKERLNSTAEHGGTLS